MRAIRSFLSLLIQIRPNLNTYPINLIFTGPNRHFTKGQGYS